MEVESPEVLPILEEEKKPLSVDQSHLDTPLLTEASSANIVASNSSMLTKEIVEEKNKLHQKIEEEEKRRHDEMEEQWKIDTQKLREQRFKRLQFLLQKSNLYTNYLMSRMAKQQEVEKEKEEKRRERLQKKLENARKQREKHQDNNEDKEECKENLVRPVRKVASKKTQDFITDYSTSNSQGTSSEQECSNEMLAAVNTTKGRKKSKGGSQSSTASSSRPATPTDGDQPTGSRRTSRRLSRMSNTIEHELKQVAEKLASSDSPDNQKDRPSTSSLNFSRSSSLVSTPVNTPLRKSSRASLSKTDDGKDNCQSGIATKRGRKRKSPKDSFSITDYFAEALSQAKKAKKEVEEIEDSNSKVPEKSLDIKNENLFGENQENDSTGVLLPDSQCSVGNNVRMIHGEVVPDHQPVLLTGGVLRDYQIEGFNWLKIIYENGINGILADEMGLGKTIQCIALISHIVANGINGPFLICAPLSTVPNWVSEFKRFAPELPVVLYHGSRPERHELRKEIDVEHCLHVGVETYPVVVTSYEIVINDCKLLQNLPWKFIIVDEGHRLKNFQCRLIKELKQYRSSHRLLLTGTPLQNNLSELWSLLNFLLPEIFDDLSSFEMWFDIELLEQSDSHDEIVLEEQKSSVLTMLHQILNPFMLRRMKSDVNLGLPPKREVLVYAPMSHVQQEQLLAIRDNTITRLCEKNQPEEQEMPELDAKGRPKRSAKKLLDAETMKAILKDSTQRDANDDISDKAFDKWLQSATVSKSFDDNCIGYKDFANPKTAEVNVKLNNIMMMLRKSTNHPYLIEYPLTDKGDYRIDEDVINTSGKMLLMDCMLKELQNKGHKVLIFSQMTKMLDIIEDYCYLRKFNYCRLDGSMKVEDRRDQIASFNEDSCSFLFLLSTRAGGLGLNLVAADTVIIYDSDWNPQNDLQAQDRCHRIGQKRPVMVYRLVSKGTIDQKIVERAAAKRKLEKLVIHKGRFKDASMKRMTSTLDPLNPEELLKMLKDTDYDDVLHSRQNQVISKKDLDLLLDRSDLIKSMQTDNMAAEQSQKNNNNNVDLDIKEKEVEGFLCSPGKKSGCALFTVINTDKEDSIKV